MLSFEVKGEFKDTENFLKRMKDTDIFNSLARYGEEGVKALSDATPVRSGATASSWYYEIKKTATSWSIIWGNSNVVDGVPIAILLQYGHGTGTGGRVAGRDYINPALRPIFDRMAASAWREVTRG